MDDRQAGASALGIGLGIAAMVLIVTVSNIAVQYPINDWLTYGALTYPIAFLVTDLTNRGLGSAAARKVVYAGFAVAVGLSIWLATPRIALASGAAFLVAQLLDIAVFDRFRRATWWRAPLISSTVASLLDTALFFSLAFAGTGLPWITWAIGDYGVKIAVALIMLLPFRLALNAIAPAPNGTKPV
ncbi:MAG: queuosine precursor transporter [Alphaproteobacteria bacterium]